MALKFVEPDHLSCTGCGASEEHLVLVRCHRTTRGSQVLGTNVYRCEGRFNPRNRTYL
jgi:hypothetical protein